MLEEAYRSNAGHRRPEDRRRRAIPRCCWRSDAASTNSATRTRGSSRRARPGSARRRSRRLLRVGHGDARATDLFHEVGRVRVPRSRGHRLLLARPARGRPRTWWLRKLGCNNPRRRGTVATAPWPTRSPGTQPHPNPAHAVVGGGRCCGSCRPGLAASFVEAFLLTITLRRGRVRSTLGAWWWNLLHFREIGRGRRRARQGRRIDDRDLRQLRARGTRMRGFVAEHVASDDRMRSIADASRSTVSAATESTRQPLSRWPRCWCSSGSSAHVTCSPAASRPSARSRDGRGSSTRCRHTRRVGGTRASARRPRRPRGSWRWPASRRRCSAPPASPTRSWSSSRSPSAPTARTGSRAASRRSSLPPPSPASRTRSTPSPGTRSPPDGSGRSRCSRWDRS